MRALRQNKEAGCRNRGKLGFGDVGGERGVGGLGKGRAIEECNNRWR